MLLVAECVDWFLQTDQTVERVVVQELDGCEDRHFLVMPLEGAGDGQLDVAGRLQTRSHHLLVVTHALSHSLEVGVIRLEGDPPWRQRVRSQTALVHPVRQHLHES
jgi:hypothetical protein